MKMNDLNKLEKHELLEFAEQLQEKLSKRTKELFSTRQRLSVTRTRLRKMKDTVQFQRQRILELYQ